MVKEDGAGGGREEGVAFFKCEQLKKLHCATVSRERVASLRKYSRSLGRYVRLP